MDISIVKEIPLSDIRNEGLNVRTDLSSENSRQSIQELAENIRLNGLLQPIVLKGNYGQPPYDIIVGQRRFLAHIMLGASSIKATFTGEIDDISALLMSISENMCRQEMNFEDISNAITKLYRYFGNDEREVQNRTGFSIRMIRNFVKIEDQATEKIKALLKNGKISISDAKRAIDASQGDDQKADILIDEIINLTPYEKKRLVDSGKIKPDAKAEELLEDSRTPKFEETIILNLPLRVHKALTLASKKLSLDAEDITMSALIGWLVSNDFLVEN